MLMGGVKPDDAWDYSSEQTGLFKLNDFVTSSELAQFLEEKKNRIVTRKEKEAKKIEKEDKLNILRIVNKKLKQKKLN